MSAYTPGQNLIGAAGNFSQQPTGALQTNGTYPPNSEYYHSQVHAQPTPTDPMHARPPRVDDALSYLDNVRQQFADNPQVYNDFLEVMREFKSHEIDTRGVIHRVSQLFSGHANLITGFNTFLPQGYEVRVSGSCIRIIQPSGEMAPIDASSLSEQENMEIQPRLPHLSTSMTRLNQQPISAHHGLAASTPMGAAPTGNVVGEVQPKYSRQIHSQQPPSLAGAIHQPSSYSTLDQAVGYATVVAAGGGVGQLPMRADIAPPSGGVAVHAADGLQSTGADVNDNKNNFERLQEGSQQPLHFDQAVGYLQKVKERFADRPNIYQEFLSILGNYQKISNDRGTGQSITEGDVFKAVEQLFADEEDLMRDFSSYLPDASGNGGGDVSIKIPKEEPKSIVDTQPIGNKSAGGGGKSSKKRLIETPISPTTAAKKSKTVTKIGYDMSVEKCLEDIPLKDFVFFERIHKALKNETVVKNFFRCLLLYNKSLVSKQELVELAAPFLSKHPDLIRQFNEILGVGARSVSPNKLQKVEHRLNPDLALQIDYSTCKRLGVSYRSLPETYERSACSGRTKLCHSVLNDTWVSFPSWSSESTESVSSKKSIYEDFMYRTEDERFEVDILIEVNSAAINALEAVRKRMEAMRPDEAQKFKLDAKYGCESPTLMGRAVKKLYGEHATKVLEGLRDNPTVAVPQVLKRLREKDTEWRSVREEFNLIWREQIEKNYLKSLDHQAMSFKTNDLKFLRNKAIIQQMETYYDERQTRIENGERVENGPHVIIEYPEDMSVIHDANELLIHHVKRQQNIPKKEKFMIKKLLRISLIPRLFNLEMENMSDDEEEGENLEKATNGQMTTRRIYRLLEAKMSKKAQITINDAKLDNNAGYTLFFGTNCWLTFVRLHHIICERLACLKRKADELMEEYRLELSIRERQEKVYERHGKSPIAFQHNAVDVQLGLRELKKPLPNPENYYSTLLYELKNLLDGITDSNTFEDVLRNMFGTSAYIMFTMDRLISTITRQMQHFVADEASAINLFQKYCQHRTRDNAQPTPPPLYSLDEQYEAAAEKVIAGQNCYKMFFIHLEKPTVSIELINTEGDEEDEDEDDDTFVQLNKWCEFVEKYASAEDDSNTMPERLPFLLRNIHARKRIADASFDPFSPAAPTVTSQFYTNEGLRAVLSAKNARPLYERGTGDILIRKGAPSCSKKNHRDNFLRRRNQLDRLLATRAVIAKNEDERNASTSAENKFDFKWFSDNCRVCLYRHRDYEYITYTRYFTLAPAALSNAPTSAAGADSNQKTAVGTQPSLSSTTVSSSLSMSPGHYLS